MKAIDIIPKPAAAEKVNDLEIKDAQLIFASVWQDLETEFGRDKLRFPKELILLGGAPGAGKGHKYLVHRQDARHHVRRSWSARCWIRRKPRR